MRLQASRHVASLAAAASMAPTAHEKKLLDASKAFDEAISKKDASQLPQLLAKDVVLHHGEAQQHASAQVRLQCAAAPTHACSLLKPGSTCD